MKDVMLLAGVIT